MGLRKLDSETRRLFLDGFLKSVGNSAATYLRQSPPDYDRVVTLTTDALDIDGEDIAKQRSKNLRRRGMALFALKSWARAADDLKAAMAMDKAYANDAETREKYAEARAAARKEAEREKKTWQGAFAKLGGEAGAAGAGSGDDEDGAAHHAKVRFSSPAAAGGPATPLSALGEPGDDGDGGGDGDASGSPAAYKRTMYAGHTPHPRRGGAAAAAAADEEDAADAGFRASSGTATEEIDEDYEEEEGGSIWPWVLGGAAALAIGVGAAYVLSRRRR